MYLHGLFQCRRRNLEKMAETVSGSRYQRLHHMLSESAWDRCGVRRQLIADANAHFGHAGALVIDESAFAKKGDLSAGVARQWNGRLGKTDNSQVGVFAAVARGGVAALVEGELYVPEEWFVEPQRCLEAGIPEDIEFRTKGEMALTMIHRLRREGLRFAYTAFDAGYGHLPWLLRELDGDGEIFLAEVHSDQTIYLCDPAPAVPERQSARGRAPHRLQAQATSLTVLAWAVGQPPSRWRRLSVREGEKGEVIADYLTQRVWLWDGKEARARCWHLLVRREVDGSKRKFCLSNAKPKASLRRLAEMQAARHFVERAFEDAKGACGMADDQVRGWNAWHHHMALVMVALMFLAKERIAHRDTADLLSCNDLVKIMRHKLPSKIQSDADLVASIEDRHRRRQHAKDFAYRKQAAILSALARDGI
ncbi:MAG: IS701 family transposase [Candidatus Accumulibacter sp.]|nr:IS701 family transposase [Accumulibacter sp.]